jgi:protein SCO1/2
LKGKTVLGMSIIVILGVVFAYIQVEIADRNYEYRGSLIDPFPVAYQFELRDQDGAPFRMQEQKGKVVLLFFGYTNCPDVCPTTLSNLKRIHSALEEQADQVVFVFITVDPERDTPEKIGAYVNVFNSSFIGLSGTQSELQPVWDGYYIFEEKEIVDEQGHEDDAGYLVAHTSRIYVIDRDGNWHLTFSQDMTSEVMTSDIIHLLAE